MRIGWRWAAFALLIWALGSAGGVALLLEYPANVSSIHWRTYPGLFVWPIFFLPAACLVLIMPAKLIWMFLPTRKRLRRIRLSLCILPIALTLAGMCGYEWFNGKPAVWELASNVSGRPAVNNFPRSAQLSPDMARIKSFDDLALSIRAKSPAGEFIPECRFKGENLPEYRAGTCYCVPMRLVTSGAACDRVRYDWYVALNRAVEVPDNRSYTFYLTRLSFAAIALIFITGFLAAVFMSCFSEELKTAYGRDYEVSRTCIQIFALLSCIWGVQRLYFNYDLKKIFPAEYGSVFLSEVMSTALCILIILGFVYAYSLNIKAVRSFLENMLFPFIFICSLLFGAFRSETMIAILRITFGVDATGPAILATVTFLLFFCLIPLIYFLRGGRSEGE